MKLLRILFLALAGAGALNAHCQDAFARPLKIMVGYAAGGPADIAVRKAAPALQAALGRPVVVENRGGAGGGIAAMAVLRQPPDGTELVCIAGDDLMLSPHGFLAARFKPEQFKLVYPLRFADLALVTAINPPPAGIEAVVELARKRGDRHLSFGNWGVGSTAHVMAADLRMQTGIHSLDVAYKGGAPILQDVTAGVIDFAFVPLNGQLIELVKSGKLHAVAVASDRRNPNLPQVPTAEESRRVRDFRYRIWPAVFARAETPPAVLQKLHATLSAVVHGAEYQAWAQATGAVPFQPMSLEQAASFYASEQRRVGQAMKSMQFKPE